MASYLSCSISSEAYAIPVERVAEALRIAWPTPVAEAPRDVLGLLNLGGRLLVVVEPAHRLGLAATALRETDYLLLVDRARERVALKIEALGGLLEGAPEAAPSKAGAPPFVTGYLLRDGAPVAVLDVDGLLDPATAELVGDIARQASERS